MSGTVFEGLIINFEGESIIDDKDTRDSGSFIAEGRCEALTHPSNLIYSVF